jgi:tetratricopeptide (TPR) repeat protein
MARYAPPSPGCRDGYSAATGNPPENNGLPLILHLADRVVDSLLGAYNRLVHSAREAPPPPATDLAQLGNGVDTVAALSRTLAVQPHNCLAWFQLGMVHLDLGNLNEAVEAFEKARRFGFVTFELHFYLAEALTGLGRHDESVAELYLALEKQPKSAEPSYRLGLSLYELGRYEEAVAAFKIAISLSPNNVKYHQSLGLALERLGRQDEALKCFTQAVKLERGLR